MIVTAIVHWEVEVEIDLSDDDVSKIILGDHETIGIVNAQIALIAAEKLNPLEHACTITDATLPQLND